ncbi:MAG: Hsp20/alpha crystallin family protein [Polyangiaceae bacterium]|nr:Hsp20/alpha crystallin family protein [Polyangiaceae bacterium]
MLAKTNYQGTKTVVSPPVDVVETDEKIYVVADLPGVKQENININVENGVLTIDAFRTLSKLQPGSASAGGATGEQAEIARTETDARTFVYHRSVDLPKQVDTGKTIATFTSGVLSVELQKAEPAKKTTIAIRSAN